MHQQNHLLGLPLEKYRGFAMSLRHVKGDRYQLTMLRARDFTNLTSLPKTFTLQQTDEAIAYGKLLIDQEKDFHPFLAEQQQRYFNECASNLSTLDTEDYDF